MSIRILIVDNQPMVRRGLVMFLQTDPDMEIVGEASNGREAIETALDQQPDLVLMDLLMPEMDGVVATRVIRQQQPDLHILALSSSTDYALIGAALLAGASTYLHKGNKPNQLLAMIKGLAAGRVILLPAVMERVLMHLPAPEAIVEALTPDEIGLLRLLAAGHSDDEIAQALHQDISTVQALVQQIKRKLSTSTRLLALLRAIQLGLIDRLTPT